MKVNPYSFEDSEEGLTKATQKDKEDNQ